MPGPPKEGGEKLERILILYTFRHGWYNLSLYLQMAGRERITGNSLRNNSL